MRSTLSALLMTPTLLWKIRAIIVATSVVGLGVFTGLGWVLDRYFGTRPLFLVLGIALSFPLVNVFSIRFTRRFLASS